MILRIYGRLTPISLPFPGSVCVAYYFFLLSTSVPVGIIGYLLESIFARFKESLMRMRSLLRLVSYSFIYYILRQLFVFMESSHGRFSLLKSRFGLIYYAA